MQINYGIPESSKCVFQGKIFSIYQREQKMFDGSSKIFEKAKRNDTIDVIATLPNGEILILEENQPGRNTFFGLVGGTCENNETPLETAKRELLEETGMKSQDREFFNSYNISSKISYKSHIFIARNCEKVQEQTLDSGGETIKIKHINWNKFIDFIASEKFKVQEFALDVLRSIYNGKENEIKQKIMGDKYDIL